MDSSDIETSKEQKPSESKADWLKRVQIQKHVEKHTKRLLTTIDRVNHQGRLAAALMLALAATYQILLPRNLVHGSEWFLPSTEILLCALLVISQKLFDKADSILHKGVVGLTLVIAAGNAVSTGLLVSFLVGGHHITAVHLMLAAGSVWLTNVVVFSLLYWEFDRGGPYARVINGWDNADFVFPQMTMDFESKLEGKITSKKWEPHYFDYLYVAVTNATAFSPTDTMPMTWKAKFLMGIQAIVSIVTVTLVAARAVNIL